MTTVLLNRRALLGLQHLADKNSSRYVMNSTVNLEVNPNGDVFLMATDGKRLGFFKHGYCQEPPKERQSVILPIVPAQLKALGKLGGDDKECWVTFDAGKFPSLVTFKVRDVSLVVKAVEGNYPNMRQVIPDAPTVLTPIHPAFDWSHLEVFFKCFRLIAPGQKAVRVFQTDALSAFVVTWRDTAGRLDDFVGMIMPMRSSDTVPLMPDWCRKKEK